jgi:CheY-like chemotaxis protein
MNPRVLIIEDNLLNLELVTDLLEAKGFVIAQAQTAEEGLRLARLTLPDLILMDLSLPGMDGLAATKVLKSDPATRHLPILALTAHAMRGDEATALEAGCDGYLTKPIDTRTLAQRISALLASRSQGWQKHADSHAN